MGLLRSRPLTALLLGSEQMVEDAVAGRKRVTLRNGHRDYRAGDRCLLVHTPSVWVAEVDLVSTQLTTLREVSREDLADDGFRDPDHALGALRQWYPAMVLDSPVTIVRWLMPARAVGTLGKSRIADTGAGEVR